jgi:hypothetical protein
MVDEPRRVERPRRLRERPRPVDGQPKTGRDGQRHFREGSPARRIFGTMAAAGARSYLRARDLPKLIALWPHELADESVEGAKLVLGKLRRALRAERRRAASGHWSYDLNRHLGLVSAYKAELERLRSDENLLGQKDLAAQC